MQIPTTAASTPTNLAASSHHAEAGLTGVSAAPAVVRPNVQQLPTREAPMPEFPAGFDHMTMRDVMQWWNANMRNK